MLLNIVYMYEFCVDLQTVLEGHLKARKSAPYTHDIYFWSFCLQLFVRIKMFFQTAVTLLQWMLGSSRHMKQDSYLLTLIKPIYTSVNCKPGLILGRSHRLVFSRYRKDRANERLIMLSGPSLSTHFNIMNLNPISIS